jgi:hypothetical protein
VAQTFTRPPDRAWIVGFGLEDWEMAIRFKVSREAMQFRLKNLAPRS